MPIIELSLAPPVRPLPELSHDVGNAEKAREAFEEASFAKLAEAFNLAFKDASIVIGNAIDQSMRTIDDPELLTAMFSEKRERHGANNEHRLFSTSFRDSVLAPTFLAADDKFSVEIHVYPDVLPGPEIKRQIDAIEMRRASLEKKLFKQAISDMRDLTRVVATELQEQIQEHLAAYISEPHVAGAGGNRQGVTGFLGDGIHRDGLERSSPDQANVRVLTPKNPYPTTATLVQGMEARRDSSEDLARARILELEMKFLEAINDMAYASCSSAVKRVLLADRKKIPVV